MVTGIFSLLFVETCIHGGMIPVSTGYTALFTRSQLGMRILDESGAVILSSASALYDGEALSRATESYPLPARTDGDTLLYAAPIAGGCVAWQEDIGAINRLHRDIVESAEKLKAANALLVEEEAVRRASQDEHEKTQLMSRLEAEISGHIIRLGAMIEQLPNMANPGRAMARVTLLLCYIKRRCNLFFMESEQRGFGSDDLAAYMDELAEIAGHSDVRIAVLADPGISLTVRRATLSYDLFYSVIYWAAWLSGSSIIVRMNSEDGWAHLRLLPSEDAGAFQIEKGLLGAIQSAGGAYALKALDDEISGIDLSFPEGGEADD
jgi:hypothetical protein